MITRIQQVPYEFKYTYFKSLMLLALVPLMPEYISFFLVIGSLLFAIKDIRSTGKTIRFGTPGIMLMAYCLYMTFTCIYSTHPFQSILTVVMWWFMLVGYFIIVNLVTNRDRLDSLLFCITTAAGAVGLLALIQNQLYVYFGIPICSQWDWLDQIVFQYVPFDLTLVPFPDRAYSTFPNPNMLAQYLVMALPFVVTYTFMEKRKAMHLYNRICLVLTAIGVLVSFSRGAYLALIALAVVIIIINIRKRFATVLLYVSAALLFTPQTVYSRLTTLCTSGRQYIWAEALRKIAERPIFGYGAGTQPTAAIFHQIGLDAPHAHSIILQPLMEGGAIALLLLAGIGFYLVKNGFKLMLRRVSPIFWAGFALCGFVLTTGVHGLVDYPLTTPKLICIFLTLVATCDRLFAVYSDPNQ